MRLQPYSGTQFASLQAMACGLGTVLPSLLPSPAALGDALPLLLASLPEPSLETLPVLTNLSGTLHRDVHGELARNGDGGEVVVVGESESVAREACLAGSASGAGAASQRRARGGGGAAADVATGATATVPAAVARGLRGSRNNASQPDASAAAAAAASSAAQGAEVAPERWRQLLRRSAAPLEDQEAIVAVLRLLAVVLAHGKVQEWVDDALLLSPEGFKCALALRRVPNLHIMA